jgi:HEAT repeat protein
MDTLTGIGPDAKEALPAIKKRLSGGGTGLGDAGPTIAVATAIWKIGGDGDGAVALLLPALQDAKPYSSDREKALKALGEMGPGAKKAVPALVELLKSAGPGVSMGDSLKENVIETLGKIGPGAKAAVPALLEVAKSNASYGRIAGKAVLALGQIGPDAAEAVPVLIRKLDRGEYEVKKNVPVALSQMGPAAKKAIPKLEQMIDSPFGVFRMQAATALWRLDGQVDRPVQIAIATLKEGDYASDDRMLALKVLGEMGPKAKSATKLLKLLSSDPNTEIREGAKAALAKIEA